MTPLHTIAIISVFFIGGLAGWSIWDSAKRAVDSILYREGDNPCS